MRRAELPREVRELISRHIDSAQQVEILVLLAREPDVEWTADAASKNLRIAVASCEQWLERFAAGGLVDRSGTGYRHMRATDTNRPTAVEQLAAQYTSRRKSIIDLIYSRLS